MSVSNKKIAFTFAVLLGFVHWTKAQNHYQTSSYVDMICKMRNPEEVTDTQICIHGAALNPCGKLACLKGVGDKCGSSYSEILIHGKCANGLMCCGNCVGCKNRQCDSRLCQTREKGSFQSSNSDHFNVLDYINYF